VGANVQQATNLARNPRVRRFEDICWLFNEKGRVGEQGIDEQEVL